MALSFFHPLLRHIDADPDIADALLGFVHDPLDPAMNSRIDQFLDPNPSTPLPDDDEDLRCGKMPRGADTWALGLTSPLPCNGGSHGALHWSNYHGGTKEPMQMAPAPLFVCGAAAAADAKIAEGAATNGCRSAPSAVARERRKRISEKTAELSRLVPGGRRLNTAEMLREAGRHVRLLQAQVGVLALMRTIHQRQEEEEEEEKKMPSAIGQERIMHALLASGRVQEWLAAEGKCLVPRKLVDAMVEDIAVKSNAVVSRDLSRFVDSLLPVPEPEL